MHQIHFQLLRIEILYKYEHYTELNMFSLHPYIHYNIIILHAYKK